MTLAISFESGQSTISNQFAPQNFQPSGLKIGLKCPRNGAFARIVPFAALI